MTRSASSTIATACTPASIIRSAASPTLTCGLRLTTGVRINCSIVTR